MGGPCDCSPFKGSCLALHSPLTSSHPSIPEKSLTRPICGWEPRNFLATFPHRTGGNLRDLPQGACSMRVPDPAGSLPADSDCRNPKGKISHGSVRGTSMGAAWWRAARSGGSIGPQSRQFRISNHRIVAGAEARAMDPNARSTRSSAEMCVVTCPRHLRDRRSSRLGRKRM